MAGFSAENIGQLTNEKMAIHDLCCNVKTENWSRRNNVFNYLLETVCFSLPS